MLAVRSMIVAGLAMAGSGMAIRVVKGSDPTSTGSASEVTATDDVSAGRKVPGGGNGNYPTGSEVEKEMEAALQKIAEEEEKYDAERKANVIKIAEELMKKDPKLTKEEAEESAEEEVQFEEMEQFQKEFEQFEEKVEEQVEAAVGEAVEVAVKEVKQIMEEKEQLDKEVDQREKEIMQAHPTTTAEDAHKQAADEVDTEHLIAQAKNVVTAVENESKASGKTPEVTQAEVQKAFQQQDEITDAVLAAASGFEEAKPIDASTKANLRGSVKAAAEKVFPETYTRMVIDHVTKQKIQEKMIALQQEEQEWKMAQQQEMLSSALSNFMAQLENKPAQGTSASSVPDKIATGHEQELPAAVHAAPVVKAA